MEILSEGAEALGPDRGRLVCPWDLVAAVAFSAADGDAILVDDDVESSYCAIGTGEVSSSLTCVGEMKTFRVSSLSSAAE